MSTPNKDLFVETLAHIERDPKAWDQSTWMRVGKDAGRICSTAGCMAGWVCLIAGQGHPVLQSYDLRFFQDQGEGEASIWRLPDGETTSIDQYAIQLLGIEGLDSDGDPDRWGGADDALFSGSNDLDNLYAASASILKMDEDTLRAEVAKRVQELKKADVNRARHRHVIPDEEISA